MYWRLPIATLLATATTSLGSSSRHHKRDTIVKQTANVTNFAVDGKAIPGQWNAFDVRSLITIH